MTGGGSSPRRCTDRMSEESVDSFDASAGFIVPPAAAKARPCLGLSSESVQVNAVPPHASESPHVGLFFNFSARLQPLEQVADDASTILGDEPLERGAIAEAVAQVLGRRDAARIRAAEA